MVPAVGIEGLAAFAFVVARHHADAAHQKFSDRAVGHGRARIVDDADYFDDLTVSGKRPILAVEITVDEVFYHCPKAFLRSDLWKPDSWRPDALPSVAEITRRVMPEAGNERFTEDSFRPYLY